MNNVYIKLLEFFYQKVIKSIFNFDSLNSQDQIKEFTNHFNYLPFLKKVVIFTYLVIFRTYLVLGNFNSFENFIFKSKRLLSVHSGMTSITLLSNQSKKNPNKNA
jgi:hypothetical protein